MASVLVLSQCVILLVLLFTLKKLPLMFRLLIGLIITWPVLILYAWVDLPSGVPDIQYPRAFVGCLILGTVASALFARRYRRSPQTVRHVRERLSRLSGGAVAKVASASVAPGGQIGDGNAEVTVEADVPSIHVADRRRRASAVSSKHDELEPLEYLGDASGIPFLIKVYVGLVGIAIVRSALGGNAGSTAIATFLDSTLVPLAVYFLAKKYVDSRQRLWWLMGAITASAFITAFTGIYENTLDLGESPFPIEPINENGDTRWLGVPGGRAAGVLANPAIFGGVVGMGLLSCLALLVHCSTRSKRFLLASVALVLTYGVFVCYTRSAWISVAVALLFAQFFLGNLWKITTPLMVTAVVVLGIVWGTLAKNEVVQNRVLEKENVTGRIERIVFSWERFLEQPILGRGPGALDQMMGQVYQENFDTSHNTFMTMLVDLGLIRFALFLAVVGRWFVQAAQVLRSGLKGQFEGSVAAVMIGFFLIWLLSGMNLELNYFPFFIALFWLAGAVVERLNLHVRATETRRARARSPQRVLGSGRLSTTFREGTAQLEG